MRKPPALGQTSLRRDDYAMALVSVPTRPIGKNGLAGASPTCRGVFTPCRAVPRGDTNDQFLRQRRHVSFMSRLPPVNSVTNSVSVRTVKDGEAWGTWAAVSASPG